MTELKIKGLKEFNRAFINFNEANKEAVKNTLNICAAVSRKNYIRLTDKGFYNKTKFVQKSIAFDRVKQESINNMESKVGALNRAKFMLVQEEGGTRHKRGNHYSIASTFARGGSNKNLVKKEYYVNQLVRNKMRKAKSTRSRKSQAVAMMYMANKLGKLYSLDKGIYSVLNFNKPSRNSVDIKTKLLYAFKKSPIKIKGRHYLEKAIDNPSKDIDTIYEKQLKKAWKKEI